MAIGSGGEIDGGGGGVAGADGARGVDRGLDRRGVVVAAVALGAVSFDVEFAVDVEVGYGGAAAAARGQAGEGSGGGGVGADRVAFAKSVAGSRRRRQVLNP